MKDTVRSFFFIFYFFIFLFFIFIFYFFWGFKLFSLDPLKIFVWGPHTKPKSRPQINNK